VTIAMNPTAAQPFGTDLARRAPVGRSELQRRRREARYRRRRAVVGLLVAGVVGVGVLVADSVLTGPGGVPASAAGAGTARPTGRSVRADVGDSLWSIAEVHHGTTSITRYVEALISLNGGTTIEVGQLVALP
jgi:hypothetical protein